MFSLVLLFQLYFYKTSCYTLYALISKLLCTIYVVGELSYFVALEFFFIAKAISTTRIAGGLFISVTPFFGTRKTPCPKQGLALTISTTPLRGGLLCPYKGLLPTTPKDALLSLRSSYYSAFNSLLPLKGHLCYRLSLEGIFIFFYPELSHCYNMAFLFSYILSDSVFI